MGHKLKVDPKALVSMTGLPGPSAVKESTTGNVYATK